MKTKIIYEDQDILISHKPAGLATQSASVSQPDVVSELKKYLGGSYLGIVHRLDQPVEGLLVFARNQKAAAALSRQLTEGILHKRYCALVYGKPPKESGQLVDYLCKEGSLSKVVPEGTKGAQKAVLQYQVRQANGRTVCRGEDGSGDMQDEGVDGTMAHSATVHSAIARNVAVHGAIAHNVTTTGNYSCLDIYIETGRFHQIRCQLSHAGMPILGDRKYGTKESLEESRRQRILQTALCACEIRLRHPVTGQEIFREIVPDWINLE